MTGVNFASQDDSRRPVEGYCRLVETSLPSLLRAEAFLAITAGVYGGG